MSTLYVSPIIHAHQEECTCDDCCRLQECEARDYQIILARMSGTLQTRILGHWEVTIAHHGHQPNIGYFEHDETGDGGSLWLDGRRVVDYDGVFELPTLVQVALADLGYVLDWTVTGAPAPDVLD